MQYWSWSHCVLVFTDKMWPWTFLLCSDIGLLRLALSFFTWTPGKQRCLWNQRLGNVASMAVGVEATENKKRFISWESWNQFGFDSESCSVLKKKRLSLKVGANSLNSVINKNKNYGFQFYEFLMGTLFSFLTNWWNAGMLSPPNPATFVDLDHYKERGLWGWSFGRETRKCASAYFWIFVFYTFKVTFVSIIFSDTAAGTGEGAQLSD